MMIMVMMMTIIIITMIMMIMMVMTITLLQDPAGLLDDCPKLTNLHQNGDNVDVE